MRRTVAVIALFFAPQLAHAQAASSWSMQLSGLYQGLSGDAYAGFGGGVGAEGQLRYDLGSGRTLGAGLQFSSHSYDQAQGYNSPLTLFGVFVEPRFLAGYTGAKAATYFSARFALLTQSTSVSGVGDVSASGFQVNGGGGILVQANPRTNFDFGATVGLVQFGDYSTNSEAGSGFNIVLRVGLSIALGR